MGRIRPGAQPRGEETRRRILEAALELFARDGFEGASTRTLAERAGVNLPAIQYYFGSKEGLYRAVVEEIIAHMEAHVGPQAERIRAALAGEPDRPALIDLICGMLDIVTALMLDQESANHEWRHKFFARMEAEPDAAFAALQDSMVRNVSAPCAAVIGRLVGRPADDEQVLLRTLTIIGQAKMFCGWAPSRVLCWDSIDAHRVQHVQALLREHIHAIFRDPPDP